MESPAANPAAICKENTMAYPLTHALARPLGLAAATLTALLALAGAAGETEAEMLDVLRLPQQDALHAAFNAIDQALRKR